MSEAAVIRSAIPGRERWQVDALRAHPRHCTAVERSLSAQPWTREARANALTGRLLVVYDPGVPRGEVRERIHASLGVEPASPDDMRAWQNRWPDGFRRSALDAAVRQARNRLILSGTLLGGLVAKRLLFGAGPFAASPLLVGINGLVTIVRGYRLLRNAVDGAAKAVGLSATLTSATSLALLAAQESLDGVGALAAAHTGEYLYARARRDTRVALEVLDGWWQPREASPFPRAGTSARDSFDSFSDVALVASAGMLLATHDVDRSAAMLLGACPVAAAESTITARALSLRKAVANGILFRDPDRISALLPRPALVIDGNSVHETLAAVLRRCGITRVLHLPEDLTVEEKGAQVRELRAKGFAPIVIGGDGDRTAELLAQADLGIAFAQSSTPESLRVADVILVENGMKNVAEALELICSTSSIVRQHGWLSQLAGLAGFTAAALGKLHARNAARLHNYARVAMEVNSLRLQNSFS